MMDQESDKEREVRQAIEARLPTGETLLGYTTGKIMGVTAPAYYIGLTAERFIFLPLIRGAPSDRTYSIRRDRVKSSKLKWGGFTASRLEIWLPNDRLDVSIQGRPWRKRAQVFANAPAQPLSAPGLYSVTLGQQHLQQAQDFQGLGLTGLAQGELDAAVQADPMLSAKPAVMQALKEQLAETRLAFRIGSGFLFGYVGLLLALTGFLAVVGGGPAVSAFWDFELLLSLGISVVLGIQLWRGQRQARIYAVYVAFISFLVNGLLPLLGGDFLALISQGAFSSALILVLTGESKRSRTWVAVGIYVFGYLVVLALSILISFVAALAAAQ